MPAVAFSNNDIAVVAWTFDKYLDDCLGFAIFRVAINGDESALRALARFEGQPENPDRTTEQAPVQKFWWKDLDARRGSTYRYRIVPMGGSVGSLTPLAGITPLVSNPVKLTEDRAPFKAYFNRGIVATQALTKALNGKPSIDVLKPHIEDPDDAIRQRLSGQLMEGLTSLLDRADTHDGTIRGALYELDDPRGLEVRLHANPSSRTIILGNERQSKTDAQPATDDADATNRANLKDAGVSVVDRILPSGRIPHNKFLVLTVNDEPIATLTGSTNWTSTGLCTQTNNALIIESKAVARCYLEYWNAVRGDVEAAAGDQGRLQSPTLRTSNHEHNEDTIVSPIHLGEGVTVEPLFSPSTPHLLPKNPTATPNDMQRVFDLIAGAKESVLFLAFDPGNNSILNAAGQALAANPRLFVRGALTNAERARQFTESVHTTLVGSPHEPGAQDSPIDYRAIPAGYVSETDAFGAWEEELAKYGHAIIHNKIVVIDPFSDNCTVVTGSHNLGFRASHNNDENMVVVRGHRGLAEAYACHVLDIYDHYAWRYWLNKNPTKFGKPLSNEPTWQRRYIRGESEKSPELLFWLAAAKDIHEP